MSQRLALIQHSGDKWVVQVIRYTRIQSDRRTTGVFVDKHIGPVFNTLGPAVAHLQAVYSLLHRVAFQDEVIADPCTDRITLDKAKSARHTLLRELSAITENRT